MPLRLHGAVRGVERGCSDVSASSPEKDFGSYPARRYIHSVCGFPSTLSISIASSESSKPGATFPRVVSLLASPRIRWWSFRPPQYVTPRPCPATHSRFFLRACHETEFTAFRRRHTPC